MPKSDHILAELKTLHPRLIDLSLGRIEALLAKLGHPEQRLPPVIHVAGTNGKGSVAAFLKAMLEAAGKRVHVYTSPHLVRFHERIAIAGADGRTRPIDESELVDRLLQTQRINAGDAITQFEITTAAAFQAFADHPADALILEVGLGGRLDATNVVARPALSIITPVAFDHADKLGDTIAKIAWEKAGILKPGVTAVISQQPDEALEVIAARAMEVSAPLFVWGRDYEAFEQRGRLVEQQITGTVIDKWFEKITAGLTPEQEADLKRKFSRMDARILRHGAVGGTSRQEFFRACKEAARPKVLCQETAFQPGR